MLAGILIGVLTAALFAVIGLLANGMTRQGARLEAVVVGLADLRVELRDGISGLRGELHVGLAELRGEMPELRGEVRAEFGEVRGELGELRAGVRDHRHSQAV